MDSAVAERLAKLLRLICDRSIDGETLAAAGRLSAIAAAHDVDWDRLLANGGAPALSEEQMSEIYSEGYRRGHSDGQQEARPARDWTPADNTKAYVGEDADRLRTILAAAALSREAGLLGDKESTFLMDMAERFARYGSRLFISERQWKWLDSLEEKFRRQDFI